MQVKKDTEATKMEVPPDTSNVPVSDEGDEAMADAQMADAQTPHGQKRSADQKEGPRRKKAKGPPQRKNPLMQLNEMKKGLKYIFGPPEGPPHDPLFVVSVEVEGKTFTGKGNSKQLAKHVAADSAITELYRKNSANQDFTVDSMDVENESNNQFAQNNLVTPPPKRPMDHVSRLEKITADADNKSPVMMLNTLHPGLTYKHVRENPSIPSQRFTMSVVINDEVFEGCGQNKKLAKAAAARTALCKLYNVSFHNTPIPICPTADMDPEAFNFPQVTADRISKCVSDAFNSVMVGEEKFSGWNVLAGIVLTRDAAMEEMQVVGLGTGTKHLNGEHLSMVGAALNDCHGEILAHRCLIDYFYAQLELHVEGREDESIFVKQGQKFHLKPEHKFHLYISTSPCGDGRVFSVHEDDDDVIDQHPNRKLRGLLRVKIESGEGTIPVKEEQCIQTWDGILQGLQRYFVMSCSDKIASWNVVGLQGALLSKLMAPVYLDSIILGRLFHRSHIYRAVYGRLQGILNELPSPYILNKPKLCPTTSLETRQISKSPPFGIAWTYGQPHPEVITCKTGKPKDAPTSRLSKRAFLARYANLHLAFLSSKHEAPQSRLYSSVKKSAEEYQEAKRILRRAFAVAEYGSWVRKPTEQDEFDLLF